MVDLYDRAPPRVAARSYYATVVSFPIACFALTLLTDLAYWRTTSVFWESFSDWLLAIGLVASPFAILAGLIDLVRSRKLRGLAQPWLAVLGQVVALGLSVLNVLVHSRDGYTAVVPQGVALSAVVVLILVATGLVGRPVPSHARSFG